MSEKEVKASRTTAEIQQEYSNLCTKAGHLNYSIFVLQADLKVLNDTMRDLNFEALASSKVEAEAKASAESEAPKSESKESN